MIDLALAAFVNFVVIIDPIGVVPFFMAHTAHLDAAGRRATALKSVTIAAAILLFFTLVGQPRIHYLGVSVAAFRIAGGVLLLLLAVDMVLVKESGIRATTQKEEEEASHRPDIAVFPLAVPLIAGPGAMGATILLMADAKGDLVAEAIIIGMMLAVLLLTLGLLLITNKVLRLFGVTAMYVISRVFGVLLSALAVQFMFDGLAQSGLLGN